MGSESLSISKLDRLTLALGLLAVVFISESLAFKCLVGDDVIPIEETECSGGNGNGGFVCTSYIYHDGKKEKKCESRDQMKIYIDGEDTCLTGVHKDYEAKKLGKDNPHLESELKDFVRREEARGNDPMKEITVCTCTTDNCNTDSNDDALKEASKDKPKIPSQSGGGGDGGGAATSLVANFGNFGAVMCIGLAVLAAIVPGSGSGFRRSQE